MIWTTLNRERMMVLIEQDVIPFRNRVKDASVAIKMGLVNQTKLITAASELARNMLKYANGGQASIESVTDGRNKAIKLVFEDRGPGIQDINKAMEDGYSTGKSLGLGLPGTKRLVNQFEIKSKLGEGTTVTIIKWANG
ncbi:anti-sigma regulatory factor [Sphingobacterium multivorum]|uniref:anti-sigma regulatory factor n=1 Tax=Sphingobacterium multivorum TaxID=28454 RepID=UPI001F2315B5|nr:anti-sigma regulatory factor [Sphingobacterium multivorum]